MPASLLKHTFSNHTHHTSPLNTFRCRHPFERSQLTHFKHFNERSHCCSLDEKKIIRSPRILITHACYSNVIMQSNVHILKWLLAVPLLLAEEKWQCWKHKTHLDGVVWKKEKKKKQQLLQQDQVTQTAPRETGVEN